MRRVLEIASELPPVQSGVARAVGRVAAGLEEKGYEFDFVSSSDAPRHAFGDFRLSLLGLKWIRLQQLVDGYDIVHVTGPAPFITDTLMARWRCARGPLPKLVYTHAFTMVVDAAPRASHVYRKLAATTFAAADAVVATSPSYQDIVERCYDGHIVDIPWAGMAEPPTTQRSTHYDGSRPLRVLLVGQQRAYKGVDDLITATAGLKRVDVTIAGKGRNEQQYRDRIANIGASNIEHLGSVPDSDLDSLFSEHDIICLPSTNASEAFGLVLVEAMAHGCVPVASDLPGVCDVVGKAGVLVPKQSPLALRAAFDGLARSPELVAELSVRATAKAATYSWRATVDAYDQLYRSLTPELGD